MHSSKQQKQQAAEAASSVMQASSKTRPWYKDPERSNNIIATRKAPPNEEEKAQKRQRVCEGVQPHGAPKTTPTLDSSFESLNNDCLVNIVPIYLLSTWIKMLPW
jgi:hypothetical protein